MQTLPIARSEKPSGRIVVQPPNELPRTLVSEYLDDSREDLSTLDAALTASDYDRAQVFGHQMKATGRPYGFPDLTRLGIAIEQAASHKAALELNHLFQELEDYLSRVEIAPE
jgi:HPt (histidine-containing phosphotransfer) domain-containing protein